MDVEIWSDIACPWCYVGKRRLEAALEGFEHKDQVTITWRSFELDPTAPAERGEAGQAAVGLAKKYGTTVEKAREMEAQMAETARGDGLDFHFEKLRPGNTFDGHRVLHLAHERGVQDAVKERFMRGYLTDGELMSDHATLVRLAGEAGLDEAEVAAVLASDRYAEEVRADEALATGFGASAVPFFVVDRAIGASGAHPPEQLLQLLQQGWDAKPRLQTIQGGESCGPDGC